MRTIDEIEARVNFFVRTNVIAKVGAFLASIFPKLSPNTITIAGIIAALIASSLIVWFGLFAGAFAMLLSSLFDSLDGGVARAKNNSTSFGAFLDDVADRVGEIFYFSAIFCLNNNFAVFFAGISSVLVSYFNASAKARGFKPSSGTVTGRPGRIIILFILMLASPWFLISQSLWLIVGLNIFTLVKRGLEVQKQSG